jgi:uncharacterized protein
MDDAANSHVISSIEALREFYREPSALVRGKVHGSLDGMSAQFIECSRLVMLATTGADGRLDVSPRGGPAGFVRVDAQQRVLIPDLNGNNLLDSLQNIVHSGRVGALFIRPGLDETVRVNGRAWITVAPEVLSSFTAELRVPKCAVVIEPDEVFIHCAKAFRRSDTWQPDSWQADGPDVPAILACQLGIDDSPELRASFAKGYADDLALD